MPTSSPHSIEDTSDSGGGGIPFPLSSEPQEMDSPSPTPPQRRQLQPPRYAVGSAQPFARSAAKRQSVTELPSIAHLQHQFLKAGLSSPSATAGSTTAKNARVTPVRLPHIVSLRSQPAEWSFPPSPIRPEVDSRMPWERVEQKAGRSVKGENELRKEVWSALEKVCQRWNLVTPLSTSSTSHTPLPPASPSSTSSPPQSPTSPSRIPDLLSTTTLAIRAVQNYVVSLPPEALFLPSSPSSSPTTSQHPRTVSTDSSSSSSNGGSSGPPTPEKNTFAATTKPLPPSPSKPLPNLPSSAAKDGLQTLRRAALDVLQCLEEIEARFKVIPSSGREEDVLKEVVEEDEDAETEVPNLTRSVSSASASTQSNFSNLGPGVTGEERQWKELGDVRTELSGERRVVRGWINLVDKILLRTAVARGDKFGFGDAGGRVPMWALEREAGEELGARVVESFLKEHLNDQKGSRLRDEELLESEEEDEEAEYDRLLDILSDGQLLCLAYNTSLRSSSRPFGFIPKDQIWDLTSVVRSDSLPPTTPPTPLRPVSSLGLSASTTPTRPNSSLGYSSTSPNARPGSSLGILTTPSRPHSSTGIAFSTPMRRDLSSSSSSSGVSDATTAATSVGMSRGESANEKSEKERVGMTFRRVENLKIWAGALKFRYLLSPASGFDPKLVGRREGELWKQGLRGMIETWISEVGREWREERGL